MPPKDEGEWVCPPTAEEALAFLVQGRPGVRVEPGLYQWKPLVEREGYVGDWGRALRWFRDEMDVVGFFFVSAYSQEGKRLLLVRFPGHFQRLRRAGPLEELALEAAIDEWQSRG